MGLVDRDALVTHIDDEQCVRQALHVLDAAQAAVELLALAPQHLRLALAALLEHAARGHLVDLSEPADRLPDGLEVRQHAAEPAMAHVRHAAAGRLAGDRVAGGTLRTDEQHAAAVGDQVLHEVRRLDVERQGLLEVDDVDPVTLAEDVRGHLRVPEAGLVSEMDARLQHLPHGHAGHGEKSPCGVEPPRIPCGNPPDLPVLPAPGHMCRCVCGFGCEKWPRFIP